MHDIALRLEGVSKRFRKGETFNSLRDLVPSLTGRLFGLGRAGQDEVRNFWALRDVSFEVFRGEAFGIIGANGAGKSTMLKLISKIMRPTSGAIDVKGRVSALIEVGAGLHPDLTGRENIYLNGAILGMKKNEIDAKFAQIVDFSGLAEFLDTPVKRYSSGMYARLGFSVAAHIDPELLIVDEVLSVGDWAFQVKCIERMRKVIGSGATVLFVSHNLKTITEFCQRCVLLDRGRVVMIGKPQEAVAAYLKGTQSNETERETKPVVIEKVTVRNQQGECVHFFAGEQAWVDVELRARVNCHNLSVSLFINDEHSKSIFDANTERLGYGHFSLKAGDVFACTFELNMNLANGTFYPSISVYRYDIERAYDRRVPAATIYMTSEGDVRGAANCFPKVIRQQIRTAHLALSSNCSHTLSP